MTIIPFTSPSWWFGDEDNKNKEILTQSEEKNVFVWKEIILLKTIKTISSFLFALQQLENQILRLLKGIKPMKTKTKYKTN